MGALADAIQAGIPKEIVLPILPATQSFFGKGHGKAPARFNPTIGCWAAIDNWERGGLDKDLLIASEIAGCNAGVILGAYGVNLIAIDIDLRDTPNAVRWRNGIVRSFGRIWGRPLVIRETWPYRALLLVKLPPDADAGAKRIFTLYRPDPVIPGRGDSIGKIEILAHGQQAVIAGTHISGNQIQWSVNGEGERFPAPPIDRLPTFETFDALNDSVVALLEALGDVGFEYSILSASRLTGHAPPMYELGAPDVEELISLLHAMPNPREADRDIYVNVMTAIAGAREGLVARRGAALTLNDEGRIANAAAVWAASWNAPPGTARSTVDIERAKWDNDWVRPRENRVAGWPSLLRHAAAFGAPAEVLQDIAMEQARNAFIADTRSPASFDNTAIELTEGEIDVKNLDQLRSRRRVDAEVARLSDLAMADYMQNGILGQNATWVPGMQRWLVWGGDASGWTADDTNHETLLAIVGRELYRYVGDFGSGDPAISLARWPATTVVSVLSSARVSAVERVLKSQIHRSINAINNARYYLQTPAGTYDLRTLERIPTGARKLLFDVRMTGCGPDLGAPETPWFDSLTLGLSDGDPEVQDWLLHYLGYCLLGSPREDCFVVICGPGGNGKSRLIMSLNKILGSYAVSLDKDVILQAGKDKHPTSLNRLRHKRLAMISEVPNNEKWNEQNLKAITGGDEIEARNMHKDATTFRSEAGLIVVLNDAPKFERVDPAIVRRFRLINTNRTPATKVKDLEEIIAGPEGPGVLCKLMRYAQKVFLTKTLPNPPRAMLASTQQALAAGDAIYAWICDECSIGKDFADCEETVADLLRRCEAYTARSQKEDGGMLTADKISSKSFINRLRKEGVRFDMPDVARGIRLKVKEVVKRAPIKLVR